MYVFGARVPRRGEASALDLWVLVVGRVVQVVLCRSCCAARASLGGEFSHACAMCAEPSLCAVDALDLVNGGRIIAIKA